MSSRRWPAELCVGFRGAVLVSVAVVAALPATAGATVTKLTAGTGIALSPDPITSTGRISFQIPLAIRHPLSGTLFKLTNPGTGDALDAVGRVGLRAGVDGAGRNAVVARGGDGGAGVLALGGGRSGLGLRAYGQGPGAGVSGTGGKTGDGVDGIAIAPHVFGVSGLSACPTCTNGVPLTSNAAAGHFSADNGYGVFGYSTADNGGVFENNTDSWFTLYSQADSAKGYPFEAINSATGGYMYLDPNGNLIVSGTVTANGSVLSQSGSQPASRSASSPPLAGHVPTASQIQPSQTLETQLDGNVTTNGRGFATVKLPRNFDAQNKNPRYQLTTVGRCCWNARVGIWQRERHNRFVIRSSKGHVHVSWRVTAIPRSSG